MSFLTSYSFCSRPKHPGGRTWKILNRGARFTFLGVKLAYNLLFGGKKLELSFWVGNFWNFFFGVTQGDKIYFGRRSRYQLSYFSVHNSFQKKDGSTSYTHIKVGQRKGYFNNSISGGGEKMYTADQMCNMVDSLEDNIFVKFGGCLFRQVIGIPVQTNCAPFLTDLFFYSYEREFLDSLARSGHRKLARSFNLCYRYIDDLIVFNNTKFVDLCQRHLPIWMLAFFWEFFRGGGQSLLLCKFLLLCYCCQTKFLGGAKVFRETNCLRGASFLTSDSFCSRPKHPGGRTWKILNRGLGSLFWVWNLPTIYFFGEKIRIVFLGRKFLKLFFWGHSRWQNLFWGAF